MTSLEKEKQAVEYAILTETDPTILKQLEHRLAEIEKEIEEESRKGGK